MKTLGRAEEALNRLVEALTYHAPPELAWQAECWVDDIRAAIREGEGACRALEAALARERRMAQEVERLRAVLYRALGALKEVL